MTIALVDDRTLRLDGESTFDIRDFGMEPPRILMLRVEPEVDVRVEIVAERRRTDACASASPARSSSCSEVHEHSRAST